MSVIKLGEFVPDSERWIFQSGTKEEINEAITWAEQNLPKTTDLDELVAKIEE